MFLQAGGGGKGIRPIQQQATQQSQQQTSQQQPQQHQNHIPQHHHHQQFQQQPLLTPSSSTHSLQVAHHQPSSQTSLHQHQQQQQQQQQHQHHGQQQSTTHLTSIQSPLLPHPTQAGHHHHHHQQHHSQHPPPHHHHPTISYYTTTGPLVISSPTQSTNANASNSTTSICSNGSANAMLRQHSSSGNGAMPTLYAPNAALLQPTATPGFVTPYMQQYPLQTTVIGAAAATALYPIPVSNSGNNGTNGSNNGAGQSGAATPQTFYQMTQAASQQQQQQLFFHAVTTGPTPTTPPHLQPGQLPYRSVPNTGHNPRHGAPTAYIVPTAQTQLFTLPPSQLTTNAPQRASLLPAPGQQQVAGPNGSMQMGQLLQAAGNPTGATTYMQAAYCTAPMGMAPAGLAGTAPLLTTPGSLGASTLQTYGHLTNVPLSSSNTSMSSQSEGYTKPRKHAIPIIHPITNENILDPKPLQKSASVEVKPSAPELNDNCNSSASAGCVTAASSAGAIDADSKSSNTSLQDKSITVSLPPCKFVTSSSSATSTGSMASKDGGKTDQQMQTDAVRKKFGGIKIEAPPSEPAEAINITDAESNAAPDYDEQSGALSKVDVVETQVFVAGTEPTTTHHHHEHGSKEKENIAVLEDKRTFPIFQPRSGSCRLETSIIEGENACGDLDSRTYYNENNDQFERITHKNTQKEFIEKQQQQQQQRQRQHGSHESLSNEGQNPRTIHDKGQQIFIPKRGEPAQQIQIAKREQHQQHTNFMPAFSIKPKTMATHNMQQQEQQMRDGNQFSAKPSTAAGPSSATTCSTTTLVPTNTVTSTSSPTKMQHNTGQQQQQQQQQRRQRGGNKQNVPSTATSSCSSISSSSGVLHVTEHSSTNLCINATKSSTTLVGGGNTAVGVVTSTTAQDVEAAATAATFVKPAPTIVWSAKHQQQQAQQQQQLSTRNTPATSDASSSTASTPTHHSSQHSSTTASTTPTNSKRQTKHKKRDKKKKSTEIINRNQSSLNVQQSQQQLLLPQKQASLNSVRGSVSSNYNSNNNSSCSSSSNLNFCSTSSTSNHNNNNKNANVNNSNNGSNQNINNRNNMKNNTSKKVAASTTFPLHNSNATTSLQTDFNNSINYNSSSAATNNNNNNYSSYNNNNNSNKNNSSNSYIRKNSLTSSTNQSFKGQQQHQQQQHQQKSQSQSQRYISSNNSDRSSHCSLTFGGIGSDVSSVSETDSKASLSAICSDTVVVPDLKLNLLSESNTPSSSCLTSPKSNSRHWRTHEIVAQYLTDRSSDKNLGSDDQTIQFLHGSSSTCEDDEENNTRIDFHKDELSNYENAEMLEHCPQEPLEFSSNKLTLGEIGEVYFGDFCDEKDLIKSVKTDNDKNDDGDDIENAEHFVNITKINETQKSRQKVEIADTVDCVPIKTLSASSMTTNAAAAAGSGNKKITILKSNEKADAQTKKRNFEAAMRPPTAQQAAVTAIATTTIAASNIPAEKQFHRYTLTQLKELANNPHSLQPPMVRCQGDCVSQLFVARQQHHLLTHQTHATLSALAMQQHLQQYQQISYNESLEFVSSNKRRGGAGSSGVDRLKKHHEHISMMGMMPGAGGSGGGIVSGTLGNSTHQHKKDIIRVHLSLKEEIKLAECENAWTPDTLRCISSSRGASSLPNNNDLDAVLKKVRGVLNKLTPNNFEALLKELTNVCLNTQEKMQQVMLLIFEKTVSEPNFAPTYAEFCKELFKESKAETKSPFSALLINRIQTEFETNVNDADAKQLKLQPLVDKLAACQIEKEKLEIKAEIEEQEYQFRRRAWGTVRFIGEMYKVQFLTSDRVLLCIESLLEHGSEEKLEFMCKLLTTVGNLLEAATFDKFTIKTRLDNIFRRIQDIVQKSRGGNSQKIQFKISSRVRFMMQDVIDLRGRHWDQQQPRTSSATQGSSAAAQQSQQQQQTSLRRKDDKSSGGGGGGSSNIGGSTHDKSSMRGGSSYGGGSNNPNSGHQVGSQRQQRGGGGNNQNDGHFYNQKGSNKHYNSHQQQEQKVNIDVSKLKFTHGDENTPSTTKLGNKSYYLWRTSGRQMATASTSSLGTTSSTTSAGSTTQQLTAVSSHSSNSSSAATGGSSASNSKLSTRRSSTNPFDVLSNILPASNMPANNSNSETDDTFNDENTDTDASPSNTCLSPKSSGPYTTTQCKQLVSGLVEEIVEVAAGDKSIWQAEAINMWRHSNTKQQISLLHYLLMDYLHLGDVKRQQREACAKVLVHLMNSTEVDFDKNVFTEAYALFGEEFPDLLVDVPIGWEYVFEFLGPMLHENLLTFEDIWLSSWLMDTYFTERFLKAFVNYFDRAHGEDYTSDLWHKRFKLDYGQRFDYDEQRFKAFAKSNHCVYLLKQQQQPQQAASQEKPQTAKTEVAAAKNEAAVPVNNNEVDIFDVKKHIECISEMLRRKNGNDMVMEYIIQKVDINNDFLRGITELFCCDIATSQPENSSGGGANRKERLRGGQKAAATVAKQRRFEFEIFRERCLPILRLCVDSNEALELSCLDAIFEILLDNYDETTANKMICNIFDLFYDSELIPKDTFEKWYRTQSLVDDAIESAGGGASAGGGSNQTKTTKSKPSTPKKHAKQSSQYAAGGGMKSTQQQQPHNSAASQNNNNNNATHKISAELHAFMRKLL